MANKLKSISTNNPVEKPGKTSSENLKPEKEENVSLKELVKDERTSKIAGAVSLFVSLFLFISFVSYFFTWENDQSEIRKGMSLFYENVNIQNLLGVFGAFVSHFFIYKGFGVASILICTFFFIVGVNLLFNRKVWSVWRNVRYVTIGMLVLSVCLAFIFSNSYFSYGGAVGKMIVAWLENLMGSLGTGSLLFVLALSYIIWQFNPSFKIPEKRKKESGVPNEESELENMIPVNGKTINDSFSESDAESDKGNHLRNNGGTILLSPKQEDDSSQPESDSYRIKIIEKEPEEAKENIPFVIQSETEEINFDFNSSGRDMSLEAEKSVEKRTKAEQEAADIELEIKEIAAELKDEEKGYEHLPPYEPTLDLRDYQYPTLDLLETHGSDKIVQDANELENNKNQIISTLRNYDIEIQKIMATVGATVTLYEIVPAAGVRISRIKNLEDDVALSLAALGIRIIAPIPGKGTIGIEVPNVKKSVVGMKTLLGSEKFQKNNYNLPIAIGKKIDNENFIVDLASMPHLLMAGATGQGKSVGINAILVSLLYKKHPSQLKFVLIDPKKVELSLYRVIENHFLAKLPGEEDAIITDTKKVVHTLNALCIEMDNRYDLLKEAGARNIKEYNEKFIKRRLSPLKGHQFLPFIVLVIDEFADLIMTAGKEIEMPIARLAQLARAVGIHLIIATQRPSVNIITGTIKANFPSRIAFKVSSKIDSRTILDAGGAEQLIGKGDMLISHHGEITRLQCVFVDTPEVDRIVSFIQKQRGYPQAFLLPEYVDERELEERDFDMNDRDSLFEDAARLIVQNQVGSTSLLQRRMKLGYNRAGRLMDQLESAGIVGPNQGSKARDVLVKTESELSQHLSNLSL